MDFELLVGWQDIIKAKLQKAVDGDHLRLASLFNSPHMLPSPETLNKDDIVETRAQINAVLNLASGKMVDVCETISSMIWHPVAITYFGHDI